MMNSMLAAFAGYIVTFFFLLLVFHPKNDSSFTIFCKLFKAGFFFGSGLILGTIIIEIFKFIFI